MARFALESDGAAAGAASAGSLSEQERAVLEALGYLRD
jgi:hypothetical protein